MLKAALRFWRGLFRDPLCLRSKFEGIHPNRGLRLAIGTLSLLIACSGGEPVGVKTTELLPLGFDRPTTQGDTALRNLNAMIEAQERQIALFPSTTPAELVALLLERAGYSGSYDDFERVDTLSAAFLEANPERSDAHMVRASFLSAVHEFEAALLALDEAERQGHSPVLVQRARLSVRVALGQTSAEVENQAMALVETTPNYSTLSTLATVQANLGRFEEADASYRAALATYRDVSPFPVARTHFARGVMWGEMANRPELARQLYEEAVRRLPGYVVANTHLAELEPAEDAMGRLARFAETAGDPEPAGKLADLIGEVDATRADALVTQASARYEGLLERYRKAFLDHGAEFFSGPGGDAARGLAMAQENLMLRPTARAIKVTIEAAMAADDINAACEAASQAEPFRPIHPVIDEVVMGIEASCI